MLGASVWNEGACPVQVRSDAIAQRFEHAGLRARGAPKTCRFERAPFRSCRTPKGRLATTAAGHGHGHGVQITITVMGAALITAVVTVTVTVARDPRP